MFDCWSQPLEIWRFMSRCWNDSMLVFSVWSRCKWTTISIFNILFSVFWSLNNNGNNRDVDNCCQSCPKVLCELTAVSTLRLLGRFLKHDLVTPGKKQMKTSANVISESRRPGNIRKSSFIWHCMRTAGCAALMEPVVRNNGALNGRHDRDNRQGGEEEEENGKIKNRRERNKHQLWITDKETKRRRQRTKVTKASEICSLRA